MKYLSVFEKVEALKAGKTLVYGKQRQYYDKAKNVFTYWGSDYTVPQNLDLDWQIEEQKEIEYMTRLEVLEYMLSDEFKGRVVRYEGEDWTMPYEYYGFSRGMEHALLKDGQISDIRKFVK